MFLNMLNIREKEAFISLSVLAAKTNNEVTQSEYKMIEDYCKEMGIAFFDSAKTQNVEEIVSIFSTSEKSIKNIVILELLGLLFADNNYDEIEQAFLKDFADKIGVSREECNKFEVLIKDYILLVSQISETIFES